eukprot:100526-Amphidinium_carterae.1
MVVAPVFSNAASSVRCWEIAREWHRVLLQCHSQPHRALTCLPRSTSTWVGAALVGWPHHGDGLLVDVVLQGWKGYVSCHSASSD